MNYAPVLSRFWLFLVVGLLAFCSPSRAQSSSYYCSSGSASGYWKVQTDYLTRSTSIGFFNAQHQMIYEEKMAGRYLKLSKRNIALLDTLLDGLTHNRLLDAQVKSFDLLASTAVRRNRPSSEPESVTPAVNPSWGAAHSFVMLDPSVNSRGRLRIHFANPEEKRVWISLTDAPGELAHYSEWSRATGYNRYLNVHLLEPGLYTLAIKQPRQTFLYELAIAGSGGSPTYHLRRLP